MVEGEQAPADVRCGDMLTVLMGLPDKSVDLVFTSPPYENARTYGIDFDAKGQVWVDWAVERYVECCRVCKGLVAWVVEGRTKQYRWSATPALFMADLHRRGVKLRKPPAFRRVGIPGSGGPDWLRNDYEFIVCASDGKLPWSDNTACGSPPKYGCFGGHIPAGYSSGDVQHLRKAGGPYSYRNKEGNRVCYKQNKAYELANPGNVLDVPVGGGRMGSALAHENEAPFPEKLAEFFVKSFCPPAGVVLDPFSGSGTTAAVAVRNGRKAIAVDVRESQCELTRRRLVETGGGR